ncbi:hypothetical protein TIFTF001_003401 [Ficus carica]|uniref:Uncharacterized protein n=1 Tax=Ficus carica TaxID=3494 RepID=A0AA87ZH89_FICCA|nr:hypothetical protein TIFTF001_003401 [Ficus carica]
MVDATMLDSLSTAQLVFEFYCVRRFGKDRLIGTCRVWLGSLENYCRSRYWEGMMETFRAFQVRRPNGDPDQGVLNIGIMILDGFLSQVISVQVMGIALAVDYKKLITGRTTGVGEKVCTIAIL